jgi:UDP-N-acetylmuramate dehydrogenase
LRVDLDVPLAPKTTLGLGGAAKKFARVESVQDIREALGLADKVLVLGGGSNLVVRDGGFDGLVMEMAIPGISIDGTRVSVGAGVVWDEFVGEMVTAGLHGIETMSGIPGLVGATPMQNVGAYGQEVADTITSVRVYDRQSGRVEAVAPAACAFAYRSSRFKGSERWIIIDVEFELFRAPRPIKYPELAAALGVAPGGMAPLRAIRDTVIMLRRGKGMVVDANDPDSKSAGSFFMNPIVDRETVAALEARLPNVNFPRWPAGDRTKLSAGWLIERAGFTKGHVKGRVGISTKHALALVNRGGASAGELLALAKEIQEGVRSRLGIELHPEPVIVGVD